MGATVTTLTMKTLFAVLLVSALLSVATALAPLYHIGAEGSIPNEYIVVLKEEISIERRDSHVRSLSAAHPAAKIMHTWAIGNFIAFAAVLDKGALARELEHEDVKYVEANQEVHVNADNYLTQYAPDWGLDRISQVDLPLNQQYEYYTSAGTGVDAYVIDTGILTTHEEFVGRAFFGATFIDGETSEDCNGHGTHVAGTIAGKTYGVAKQANLWAVKVLACSGSGSYAGVISGIDWAVKHATERAKRAVANMSLGGGVSTAVDAAVNAAVDAGVTFVVAAGNNNADACKYSPARAPKAITVGATTTITSGTVGTVDARASYSNYGTCLDIFAPGTNIKSAWYTSNTATNVISGTSMASPHVAGAVAAHLGHLANEDPDGNPPTPAAIVDFLVKQASSNKVTSAGTNSPNKLLFSPYQQI